MYPCMILSIAQSEVCFPRAGMSTRICGHPVGCTQTTYAIDRFTRHGFEDLPTIDISSYHQHTMIDSTIDEFIPVIRSLLPIHEHVFIHSDNAFEGRARLNVGHCLTELPYYTRKTKVRYGQIG